MIFPLQTQNRMSGTHSLAPSRCLTRGICRVSCQMKATISFDSLEFSRLQDRADLQHVCLFFFTCELDRVDAATMKTMRQSRHLDGCHSSKGWVPKTCWRDVGVYCVCVKEGDSRAKQS
ncbi:uncharacterized protein BO87DRAFT_409264 [Aspergillus neoniger CBS 115656]|uniref:Uncharacterized protein n=1 Tax=Aspergillus neoniger (strain CBS 115656) TaxID=1448310 RepID=A0A318YA09_ASPNB|nr:hypothetical protein BO87DRAFT_409264 [Aspergillus neoniger CBS 115656]PYH31175.1 hypothetical protein BO87DRAFT_409264 [Aspergillus neoniger CBS 115656]